MRFVEWLVPRHKVIVEEEWLTTKYTKNTKDEENNIQPLINTDKHGWEALPGSSSSSSVVNSSFLPLGLRVSARESLSHQTCWPELARGIVVRAADLSEPQANVVKQLFVISFAHCASLDGNLAGIDAIRHSHDSTLSQPSKLEFLQQQFILHQQHTIFTIAKPSKPLQP